MRRSQSRLPAVSDARPESQSVATKVVMPVVLLNALVRPPSHSQLVYDQLKQLLRDGRVTGGSLLSESDLARQLGVSTTPVHEAVVRLESEGFVQSLPRRGVRVVHLTPEDIAEIFELREALEAEVVR